MIVTLNEVRKTVQKAVAGSRLPAGIDDDAGSAVQWLAGRGFPAVAFALEAFESLEDPRLVWTIARNWELENDECIDAKGISALFLAPPIIDRLAAGLVHGRDALEVRSLRHPLFILPQLLTFQRTLRDASLHIQTEGDGSGPIENSAWVRNCPADPASFAIVRRREAFVAKEKTDSKREDLDERYREALRCGVKVDDDVWRRLDGFAHLSYVADSDLSRRRGAGAEP